MTFSSGRTTRSLVYLGNVHAGIGNVVMTPDTEWRFSGDSRRTNLAPFSCLVVKKGNGSVNWTHRSRAIRKPPTMKERSHRDTDTDTDTHGHKHTRTHTHTHTHTQTHTQTQTQTHTDTHTHRHTDTHTHTCLLYTSPSPRDRTTSRMPSSA